ncbi:murein hydrolase activator EnvC family protein [Thermodesulfitimonas sp.]
MDIEASPGTAVWAAAAGKVAKIGTDPALGNYLLLDHGKNEATLYAHLGSIEVTLGQKVAVGEVIGTTGDDGDIAGGGLHFEYRENGRPVDPLERIAVTDKGQKE